MWPDIYIIQLQQRLKELAEVDVNKHILRVIIDEITERKRRYDYDEAMGRYI